MAAKEMQDMALDFLDPAYYGISVGQAPPQL